MSSVDTAWQPLRGDVEVVPFDGGGDRETYVVSVGRRHFLVDAPTATLIDAWRTASSYSEIAEHLSKRHDITISPSQFTAFANGGLPRSFFCEDDQSLKHPLILRLRLFTGDELLPFLRVTAGMFRPIPCVVAILAFFFLVYSATAHATVGIARALSVAEWAIVAGAVLAGSFIHELGHLSACTRYGARQDGVGFGLYWFMPSFYSEVHGSWKLPRLQRAVVDLGGLHFQTLYLIPFCIAAMFFEDASIPRMVVAISTLLMMHTLNPVLKFDGYWLLSDLSGTPNLHSRIADIGRRCVQRLSGKSTNPSLGLREIMLLLAFCVPGVAFFGHLLLLSVRQAGLSADTAVRAWANGDWWETAISTLVVILVATLAAMIAHRVLRAVISVFRTSRDG